MNDLQEKAKIGFYCNRPYGMRIDYAQKEFVLFNRYANTLGNRETGSIEKLPLESFEDVNEIPLNGIFVQNGNHTTDSISTRRNLIRTETRRWIWRH